MADKIGPREALLRAQREAARREPVPKERPTKPPGRHDDDRRPETRVPGAKFDRVAYQREYMRQRRARQRAV